MSALYSVFWYWKLATMKRKDVSSGSYLGADSALLPTVRVALAPNRWSWFVVDHVIANRMSCADTATERMIC